jgi:hypothetical protein
MSGNEFQKRRLNMGIGDGFGNLLGIFMCGAVIALAFTAVDRLFNIPWKPRMRRKK